ncbi:hypothetical protein BMS3Bbin12_00397 [bacterium BMS3Bbin12]|nr:hypothetical protein BMS3Bbin12_00397 [bacterium BMS3Bbin12]GBE50633.1 hypothetical protein BMS3Bbin13_01573 [bacterium BMS3Bbin13]
MAQVLRREQKVRVEVQAARNVVFDRRGGPVVQVDHFPLIQRQRHILDPLLPHPRIYLPRQDETLRNICPRNRQCAIRRLGAAAFAFGQRLDAQLCPQLPNRPPVALEPAAVLVGAIALGLPLGAWWEELGIVGHVKFCGVLDAPAVGAVIAEEHGVGVDLLEDLEVAGRLDLEDGLGARAEALDALAGVGRRQGFGVLPVLELAAHEGGADGRGLAALLDDDGVEFEGAVDIEDLLPVLEAEEPLPAAVVEEEFAQCAGAVIGVEPRRHDETHTAVVTQQCMGLLEEELVEIDVGGALVAEGVARVGVAVL